MNRGGRTRSVAIGVWLATLAIALAAVVFVALSLAVETGESWGFRGFAVLFAITFGTVGVLINVRVPGNRVGWLFAAVGFASALQELIAGYVVYGVLVAPGVLPLVNQIAWLETWDWVPFAGISTTFLPQLFPDGRLQSARWRPVAWLSLAAIVVLSLVLAIAPGPIGNARFVENPLGLTAIGDLTRPLQSIGFSLLVLAIALSAASMVVRFRRSRGPEREQLKWFASAAVFAGLVLAGPGTLFNVVSTGSPGESSVKAFQILTIVALLGIPISAGIAILRYRLYDIDQIVSRTISYGLVTAVLFAVFAGVNLALQGILSSLLANDSLTVAASTLAVAALFNPVRSQVQRVVDRRFNRARYDAERTVQGFANRLRDELDLGTLSLALERTTADAIQPSTASVWLRGRGR